MHCGSCCSSCPSSLWSRAQSPTINGAGTTSAPRSRIDPAAASPPAQAEGGEGEGGGGGGEERRRRRRRRRSRRTRRRRRRRIQRREYESMPAVGVKNIDEHRLSRHGPRTGVSVQIDQATNRPIPPPCAPPCAHAVRRRWPDRGECSLRGYVAHNHECALAYTHILTQVHTRKHKRTHCTHPHTSPLNAPHCAQTHTHTHTNTHTYTHTLLTHPRTRTHWHAPARCATSTAVVATVACLHDLQLRRRARATGARDGRDERAGKNSARSTRSSGAKATRRWRVRQRTIRQDRVRACENARVYTNAPVCACVRTHERT